MSSRAMHMRLFWTMHHVWSLGDSECKKTFIHIHPACCELSPKIVFILQQLLVMHFLQSSALCHVYCYIADVETPYVLSNILCSTRLLSCSTVAQHVKDEVPRFQHSVLLHLRFMESLIDLTRNVV